MLGIQDFRNMVGQYSEGYLSMTTDASGKQQLSKVANHHTFTILNPSEAKVNARLGGVAAQDIRRAFAEALRGESEAILAHPAVRQILYGSANAAEDAAFSSKPLSRREIRQVFEVLDLQKLFAKAGVAITKDDLTIAKTELYRVKNTCTSAYVKALSLLLPQPKPGKAPRGILSHQVCALVAEKAEMLHKAFLGKTDDQLTNEFLWKLLFDEAMPEGALFDNKGKQIPFGDAVDNRLTEMFEALVDPKIPEDERIERPTMAKSLYPAMGLTLSGALKLVRHPERITRSDLVPGWNVLMSGAYTRNDTVKRLVGDNHRSKSLTFGVLYQRVGRPDKVQEFKLVGKATQDESADFCTGVAEEIQRVYSDKLLQLGRQATVVPSVQIDAILSFCHQAGDNVISYPGGNGGNDKNIIIKANEDGTIDLLVSCRTCGNNNRPGSAALCRVYADGKAELMDIRLAQDHAQMSRQFVFSL